MELYFDNRLKCDKDGLQTNSIANSKILKAFLLLKKVVFQSLWGQIVSPVNKRLFPVRRGFSPVRRGFSPVRQAAFDPC